MDTESHKDLFEIRVNETGKRYLLKFYSFATIIFILNLVVASAFIVIQFDRIIKSGNFKYGDSLSPLTKWYFIVAPFFIIVHTIIGVLGLYYYVFFSKKIKESLRDNDEQQFNLSFQYLYINSLILVISLAAGSLFAIFQLLEYFSK
jgi:hypothetical protein